MKGTINKTTISAILLALTVALEDINKVLLVILTKAESEGKNDEELMELTLKVRGQVYTAQRTAFRIYDVLWS